MLTENALITLGESYQKDFLKEAEVPVRVQKVEKGAKDAVVKIGRDYVIAVSEDDNGQIRSTYGKDAKCVSHGVWDITSSEGSRHRIKLL